MKTIETAFIVWHDGMINVNPHLGYTIDTIPVVYAESFSDAKSKATEPYEWAIDGREVKFTDLRVRRKKEMDIVLFEGDEKLRYQVDQIKEERDWLDTRKKAISDFPDGSKFYVQNGYVGNSVLWWGKDGNGYTTELSKAELYTKDDILSKIKSWRKEDVIWEASHVMDNIRSHVDSQYLKFQFSA